VDAVAQAGKDGYVYVLNRETGESLFPVEERAVSVSTVEGELLAKSQKVPLKPAPFVRQGFTDDNGDSQKPMLRIRRCSKNWESLTMAAASFLPV